MNSGNYFYWKIPLPDIPCENILNFSARVMVEQVTGTTSTFGMGNNVSYSPTDFTGCNNYKQTRRAFPLVELACRLQTGSHR